jgi:sugar-specific transcriptional regulator TrmB
VVAKSYWSILKTGESKKEEQLSQEKVLKTLGDLGLTRIDSKIYIYLAKRGPQKGKQISKALKIQKYQLYRSLKKLQSKAIVSATLEHPARFSVVSFEKVIDLFIRAKLEEAQSIQHEKSDLLSTWQTIQVEATPEVPARFMVIEGRNIIYSRIKQMMNETKSQLSIISTVSSLARADQFGLLDAGFRRPRRSKVQFRLLTHLSEQNVSAMKSLLKETPKAGLRFEIRNPNLGLRLFPRMVIRDEEEVMFFITPKVDMPLCEPDKVCLWTNCNSLVDTFSAIFEELWRNSTNIERKIAEIETGKPTPKTFVISDTKAVKKKHDEILQSTKEEILLLTSSKGLIEFGKKMAQLKNCKKKGVSVKIMAPVVKENVDAAEQLSKLGAVRHVPIHYWETTIIDGKHLFQFKTTSADLEQLELTPRFDKAYYTDDVEWVKMMKTALNDIWRSAQTPSSLTLESMVGPYGPPAVPIPKNMLQAKIIDGKIIDFKPPGTITEREVMNKIIHAQKIPAKDSPKKVSRMYASIGIAAIHPPDYLNLPEMLVHIDKVEKQSTFGAEDALTIFLWLETPKGHVYVPVATLGDSPQVQPIRKAVFANTPAGQNVQLVKKDELQVRVHGNTMFAGWTVPIPLYPPPYVLPPACLLIEGYGNVKTLAVTLLNPSGFKSEIEENYFDAFVTFMHSSSKYSGPGTDGLFARDYIMIRTPPH